MNRNIILVIIGGILLCFAGLNNGYPLLTQDSGTFILNGFNRTIPFHNTIMYGLFVAHASWGKSLWVVIFSQGLLLSLLFFYYFRYFTSNSKYIIYYLACIFFFTFCMLASVIVSKISPDVFTCISLLGLGLLLFAKLNRRDFIITAIITGLSISTNWPFMLTLFLLVAGYLLFLLLLKIKHQTANWYFKAKRATLSLLVIALSYLLVCGIHFLSDCRFSVMADKKVFMLPRLLNMDGTNHFIADECSKGNLPLSSLQDSIMKYKGFDNLLNEQGCLSQSQINACHSAYIGITAQPGFGREYMKSTGTSFLKIISHVKIQDDAKVTTKSMTIKAINTHYNEIRECMVARQFHKQATIRLLAYSQLLFTCLAFLVSLYLVFKRRWKGQYLFLYVLVAILLYALTGSFFYGPNCNVLGHMMWLLALPLWLHIAEFDLLNMKKHECE